MVTARSMVATSVFILGFYNQAYAQDESAASDRSAQELTENAKTEQAATEPSQDASAEPAEEPDPMNFIGIGLKLGFIHFGNATYDGVDKSVVSPVGETEVIKNRGVPARSGIMLSIPINLGGSGFGWIVDPYMGFGDVGSYGIYTGPTITIHASGNIYVGFGIGVKVGMITANYDDSRTVMGIDLYGRVPIDFVYYVAESLGLVFELGLGYGATGYKPEYVQQEVAEGVTAPKLDLQFGDTYQIDFSLGMRLP